MKYEALVQQTIDYLQNKGLPDVEVKLIESNDFEIGGNNNDINLVRSLENAVLKVSAIKAGKKAAIELNDLSPEAWETSLNTLVTDIEMAEADMFNCFSTHPDPAHLTIGAKNLEPAWIAEVTAKGMTELLEQYPKMSLSEFGSMYEQRQILLQNTNGTRLVEHRGNGYFGGLFFAADADKTASFNYYSLPLQSVKTSVLENDMLHTLLANNVRELDVEPLYGRIEGGIVISPSCLADLLSSLEDVALQDMAMLNDSSRWKDKIGQTVTSDQFTWHARPISSPVGGNYGITADGYPAEDMTVIEKGVLKTHMLTEYVAKKTNLNRSLNQGGVYEVEAGSEPLSTLISRIDKGMMLNRLSGGHPSPNGDFSGSAKNSFIIENGKITTPLTEVMVTFNIFDVLNQIEALSLERADMFGARLPYLYTNAIVATGK